MRIPDLVMLYCFATTPEGMVRGSRKRKPLIWASAREVWKWTVLFSCVLALPEMEAPHLGVSSGGVEVDGGFAKVAGNSCEKSIE